MNDQSLESSNPSPISINWHFWPHCNYKCRFCFASFQDIPGILPRHKALTVPQRLAEAGCEKLTFTGGEPTLCPYLGDLLAEAKRTSLTVAVVSNGTGISPEFLEAHQENMDWIGLSVDSALEETERKLGRGTGCHVRNTLRVWQIIRETEIRLKLNTVVTALNWHEDLGYLLEVFQPDRWKVFQVLPVVGQNNGSVEPLLVSVDQFQSFFNRHREYNPIPETNEVMRGSYVMLDPMGRFFQNSTGKHVYSKSVLEIPVLDALNQVGWNQEKFLRRNGLYNWQYEKLDLQIP